MIRAIIFDVDGVLIDSHDANILFFKRLIRAFGYKVPTQRILEKGHAMPLIDLIRLMTKEKSEERARWILDHWADKVKYPSRMVRSVRGTAATLRRLEGKYRLAIVTNRIMEGRSMMYDIGSIARHFDIVVSFGDYRRPKPYPDPLLVAAKRLGIPPSECVYVGDLSVDKKAAYNAGMKFICFAGSKGAHPRSRYTVKEFPKLEEAISKIGG
ncbi:MAG: HAD-IA family hydrolase [Candidatus Micrarchaeota archaeon]|nr:HAD-IA family hydrolase [Candidatus Micrarchaeota archaeon]